ncbi:arylesterase [Desulfofustis glycolicus]|uniref:Acyl-CoA thioesterase-1 n=1 Tax=Desulfofustis glycolicus DSM 9705 TaxID=1121409 RepID=A0A1M5WCE2_9BACT|nr:arylesterase [Desulfofustis glycolicus]MCB2217094.1 arylesterase [Desulfobulbaceae bacterium]SHH85176.1 acyl-CoA thioesterase-1 [Desulfofustis glycolicus DSM 9705]
MRSMLKMPGILIVMLLVVSGLLGGCEREQRDQRREPAIASEPVYDGVIIAMGDSLTAGLGVAPEKSYPALLESSLQAAGLNYRVINAGVSGETSSGARSRIDWIINSRPDLVIVETGANDGFRGISTQLLYDNLAAIIESLLANDIGVLLVGMQMVSNLGDDYRSAFNAVYPRLAEHYPVTFMPFFLEGVAMDRGLNQQDTIHPNEEGYRVIVENLLPYVHQALNLERQRDRPL